MLQLAKYPEMLTAAADGFAPHDVTFTCGTWQRRTTATTMPSVSWLMTKPSLARLALVAATAQVLHNGLAVLGVDAPERM